MPQKGYTISKIVLIECVSFLCLCDLLLSLLHRNINISISANGLAAMLDAFSTIRMVGHTPHRLAAYVYMHLNNYDFILVCNWWATIFGPKPLHCRQNQINYNKIFGYHSISLESIFEIEQKVFHSVSNVSAHHLRHAYEWISMHRCICFIVISTIYFNKYWVHKSHIRNKHQQQIEAENEEEEEGDAATVSWCVEKKHTK